KPLSALMPAPDNTTSFFLPMGQIIYFFAIIELAAFARLINSARYPFLSAPFELLANAITCCQLDCCLNSELRSNMPKEATAAENLKLSEVFAAATCESITGCVISLLLSSPGFLYLN